MPMVRMRRTPTARADATSSAPGAGPRSRWVCESINASASVLDLGEQRWQLLHRAPAGARAVLRAGDRDVGRAERREQLLRRLRDVRREQHGQRAQTLRQRTQRGVELAGPGVVLGE